MPSQLPYPHTRISLRVDTADLRLLQAIHPRGVNAAIRQAVRAYCAELRAKGLSAGSRPSLAIDPEFD